MEAERMEEEQCRGPRGAGTAATEVGGKERTGLETRVALGVIQRSEPS